MTSFENGNANVASLSSTIMAGISYELFSNLISSHVFNSSKQSPIQKTWIMDIGTSDRMCHDITCFDTLHVLLKSF